MILTIQDKKLVFLICKSFEQPIGNLYSTVIDWKTLKEIAFVEPRILMNKDDEGSEDYIGIQRHLSKDRQKEIIEYVNKDPNATFPSSIIINIPFEELDIIPINFSFFIPQINNEDEDNYKNISNYNEPVTENNYCLMIFPYKKNVAQVIDGQHRMSGFEFSCDSLIFDLPITIFVDQLLEKQAEIFATINGKQTRVTPSLVYDLFGLSSKRTPYKVSNELIKLLNENSNSPLKNWIKILGKSNKYYHGYITQSTLAKFLIKLYSGNYKQAEEDKRDLLNGKKPTLQPTKYSKMPIFRDLFISEEDEIIYKAICNFFNAVSIVYSDEWKNPESVLKKTVGFSALFKVFMDLAYIGKKNGELNESFFINKLKENPNIDFHNIPLSSKGINLLYNRFHIS